MTPTYATDIIYSILLKLDPTHQIHNPVTLSFSC